ncbi:hypothetical protein DXG01_012128 [Tephrocybe rancida]|nr:hypothetical protein DXG01_012128 [Tephrocybe rancida]
MYLRDSVMGAKACSLTEFTYASAVKYKRGGPGDKVNVIFTIHTALLRNFTLENPLLLGSEADEESDSGGGSVKTTPSGPAKKKRKSTSGQIAKGKDFWSKVEKYFEKEIDVCSHNLTDQSWKDLVDRIVANDNRKFAPLQDIPPSQTDAGPLTSQATNMPMGSSAHLNVPAVGYIDFGGVSLGNLFN